MKIHKEVDGHSKQRRKGHNKRASLVRTPGSRNRKVRKLAWGILGWTKLWPPSVNLERVRRDKNKY